MRVGTASGRSKGRTKTRGEAVKAAVKLTMSAIHIYLDYRHVTSSFVSQLTHLTVKRPEKWLRLAPQIVVSYEVLRSINETNEV